MKDKKKLSVIVSSYKETTEEVMTTLISIDDQIGVKWDDIEVILVNDGGIPINKNKFTKLKNYIPYYIKLKENVGPLKCRQAGFYASKGDYVTFIDAQDILIFNLAINALQNLINENEDIHIIFSPTLEENKIKNNEYSYIYQNENRTVFHGKVFNKKFINTLDNIWLDIYTKNCEDEYFLRIYYDNIKNFKHINIPFYLYKYNENSITHSNDGFSSYFNRIYPNYLKIMSMYLETVDVEDTDMIEKKVNYFLFRTSLWFKFFINNHYWCI